ncbi:MAG: hypothetical protein HY716_12190 [Planctomycetes bacterium]|nr:hypothetical protein [Planctomycetota bacterium]
MKSLRGLSRKIITLRYGSALDVPQIAGSIGKTVQATYALLKRVRLAIRDCVNRKVESSEWGANES